MSSHLSLAAHLASETHLPIKSPQLPFMVLLLAGSSSATCDLTTSKSLNCALQPNCQEAQQISAIFGLTASKHLICHLRHDFQQVRYLHLRRICQQAPQLLLAAYLPANPSTTACGLSTSKPIKCHLWPICQQAPQLPLAAHLQARSALPESPPVNQKNADWYECDPNVANFTAINFWLSTILI